MSLIGRIMYRGVGGLILCGLATPGFIMALPLVISFRVIRHRKVRAGLCENWDEVAQTKVCICFFL